MTYDRIASQEELDVLEQEPGHTTLKTVSKSGEIRVDEDTQSPYIVFNEVRYDIEPVVEQIIDD